MIVSSPMDEEELRNLMFTAQAENHGPFSIRYPRGNGVMTEWKTPLRALKVGTGRKIKSGSDVAILTIGAIGNLAKDACDRLDAEGISAAHYDMRFVKPIDELLLHEVFGKFSHVITVEDGCIQGGFGSAVIEFMAEHGYHAKVTRLGIPDRFIEHGSQSQLYAECGYDAAAMVATAKKMLGERKVSGKLVG
jgi:1-deoxy-D-xylulose-5-phosphate synthase